MDYIKKVVEIEDQINRMARREGKYDDLDWGNMTFEDLELLHDCLSTLELNVMMFKKQVIERHRFCREKNYRDISRQTGKQRKRRDL